MVQRRVEAIREGKRKVRDEVQNKDTERGKTNEKVPWESKMEEESGDRWRNRKRIEEKIVALNPLVEKASAATRRAFTACNFDEYNTAK